MDLAEIRFFKSAFIKERGAEVIRKIRPSPILWELFIDSSPSRTAVGMILIANSAHSSVSGPLFTTYCTAVGNGAMNKFRICFQWRHEQNVVILCRQRLYEGSAILAPMMPVHYTFCAMRSVWFTPRFFYPYGAMNFMPALGIRILIANSCARWRGISKGVSQNGAFTFNKELSNETTFSQIHPNL